MGKIVQVTTEAEYETALMRLEEIFQSEPNTPEGDELDSLADLVLAYEKKYYQID